jgi:small nuclear ribonucleoprotein (snRNP)-like protein
MKFALFLNLFAQPLANSQSYLIYSMTATSLEEIPPIPEISSLKPAPTSSPSIDMISSLLGSSIRITVPSTSRLFIGIFVCIDPQGNLVIDQAREWEIELEDEKGTVKRRNGEGRDVGLVLIKREIWGKVERLRTEEEKMRGDEDPTQSCRPS